MTEETIIRLFKDKGLGDAVLPITPVSGGFIHRMYRVDTKDCSYAVKHLNSNIMKRPEAMANYKKAEALGRTILNGLDAWTAAWKADDWQYAPGKITKWLADEKYLQPPRKKAAAPEEGRGCGECGAEIV